MTEQTLPEPVRYVTFRFTLEDHRWQDDPSLMPRGVPGTLEITLTFGPDGIHITAQDQSEEEARKVWIEIDEGHLAVRGYNALSDGYVEMLIPAEGEIVTSDEAYEEGRYSDE